jgi:aspartyl/glutamyl-tRNA(Asn/Gln) amidotransferase C subunit
MTKITKEEGLKIARMSHIGLRDYELQPLIEQLEQVLSYAERVAQIASEAQEQSIKLVNVMRDDVIISTNPAPLLACAPEREGDYFVVQAILDTK